MGGLVNTLAYSHDDREIQLDCRFIGRAVNSPSNKGGGAHRVVLSTRDYYDKIRDKKKDSDLHRTTRVLNELQYAYSMETCCLVNMQVKEDDILRLIEKTQSIKTVRVIGYKHKRDYHRQD